MSAFDEAQERDMILFVGSYWEDQKQALKQVSATLQKRVVPLVLLSVSDTTFRRQLPKDSKAVVINADFTSHLALQTTLMPYKHRLLAVTARTERNIPLLRKVIPHVPYINTPTELSLEWTTDKIRMRQLLRGYDKAISPKFMVAHDATAETLDRIERHVGFPLIIKPAGLAESMLVTICYHREELEANMRNTVRRISQIYKKKQGRGEPQILVEEFMEGTMYSVDCYVNQRGVVYYTPLVHVKTGMSIGMEDFYGYMRITPVSLKPHKIEAAKKVADKAIEALNLRSTTCHIELMKTEDGWKVIELGPRVGGFRPEMYKLSYGIDHPANDILIRMPKKPILPKKVRGFTAVMQFYPERKGRLVSIEGVNKVRKLESFNKLNINKRPGDMCDFARNGDDPVFTITLFNVNRAKLLADIRRLETTVRIKVSTPTKATKRAA